MKRSKRRLGFLAGGIGAVLATTSAGLLAAAPPLPPPPPGPPPDSVVESDVVPQDLPELQAADLHQELADHLGISLEDARRASQDSAPLYDFMMLHRDEPNFGSVWASYDGGGYTAHVRYVEAPDDEAVSVLSSQLSTSVDVHSGGLSHAELYRAADALTELGNIAYFVNEEIGVIDVYDEAGAAAARNLVGEFVRIVDAPVGESTLDSNAGGDIWRYDSGAGSWSLNCTAGVMIGNSSGDRGFTTAGHCQNYDDGTGFVSAQTGLYTRNPGTVLNEACTATADSQVSLFAGTPTVYNTAHYKISPVSLLNFDLAGGWVNGQTVLKIGLSSNGTTGTNYGVVNGYGAVTGVWCGGRTTQTGLQYSNPRDGGDSGGPILLEYGTAGSWFLIAFHIGVGSGIHMGGLFGNVPLPSGYYICRVGNPC